jgi:hypothetical protein
MGIDGHISKRTSDRKRLNTGSFLTEFYLSDHGDYGKD